MVHLTVALERQAQEPLDGAAATLWDVHKLMVATQHKRRAVLCTKGSAWPRRLRDDFLRSSSRQQYRVMLPVHQTIIGHRYRIPRTRPRRHQWEQKEEVHDDDRRHCTTCARPVHKRVTALLITPGSLVYLVVN